MSISIVDKLIERLKFYFHLVFSLRTGNKNITNTVINAAGDVSLNQIFANNKMPINRQVAMIEEARKRIPDGKSVDPDLKITLGILARVIQSIKPLETGIQLIFTIVNSADTPKVIQGLYAKLSEETVYFNNFFKLNQTGQREPDTSIEFPVIIEPKHAIRLCVELKTSTQTLIIKDKNMGELFVLAGEYTLVSKKFELLIDEVIFDYLGNSLLKVDNNTPPIDVPVTIIGLC